MVLFSGIQPTGLLHIGNYFGAVKNWVDLQHKYTSIYCVVDYHAITIQYEVAQMPSRVMDLATNLYACGIDPKVATLFVQSWVPGHADLAWIFNTVTPLGELERMTQFKDKSRQNRENVNVGLLDYPVLQAADILLYKAEVVPVGEDQVQHVEFTREIARHFNARYGETFPECKALLTPTPRVMGLDGESKMSKSRDNYIGLLEPKEQIWKKLAPAVTDPARKRRTDPGNPDVCNIYSYHKLVDTAEELQTIATGCRGAGIGCVDCKRSLLDNLMKTLDPIQARHRELVREPEAVEKLLTQGAESCGAIASKTMVETKKKLGLRDTWKI